MINFKIVLVVYMRECHFAQNVLRNFKPLVILPEFFADILTRFVHIGGQTFKIFTIEGPETLTKSINSGSPVNTGLT